ncbi:MAG: YIP1 family protein [Rhodocyclaceae bacterium]|nr:YIP1 family protein [Rhodocyclaceae bacterium]MCA3026347.1 YIP1 family protein [Rhodocyclaceae bacterium]MCA3032978.1 YIP1 family protein [Rhodocyclaceae bacterium]MCA3036383.1 YIP1 family protein [Rhodocyclaceae bacterium]MCA3045328.1 YIP1 family protein [Rhodocyclaceae bacterium]
MKKLEFAWQLLLNPATAFQALKEKPNFWFPLIVISVLTAATFVWFYSIVDFPWLRDQILSNGSQYEKMTAAQREQASGMLSKNMMMWSTVIGAVVVLPIVRLLEALYYLFIGKLTRLEVNFKQWFALTCWSGFPAILAVALMWVVILLRSDGRITPDALSILSLNELIFHVPLGHKWHGLLTSVTILNPYVWWLTVVGVKVFSQRSTTYSAVVVIVPLALIYAVWATFTHLFAG